MSSSSSSSTASSSTSTSSTSSSSLPLSNVSSDCSAAGVGRVCTVFATGEAGLCCPSLQCDPSVFYACSGSSSSQGLADLSLTSVLLVLAGLLFLLLLLRRYRQRQHWLQQLTYLSHAQYMHEQQHEPAQQQQPALAAEQEMVDLGSAQRSQPAPAFTGKVSAGSRPQQPHCKSASAPPADSCWCLLLCALLTGLQTGRRPAVDCERQRRAGLRQS